MPSFQSAELADEKYPPYGGTASAQHGLYDCRRLGIRREKGVEVITCSSHHYAAIVGEFAEALDAVVAPDAARANAAEPQRRQGALDGAGVYCSATRNNLAEDLIDGRWSVAEDIQSERAFSGIDHRDRVIDVVIGHNRKDRTENFFLHDAQIGCGVDYQRDGHAARSAVGPTVGLKLDDQTFSITRFLQHIGEAVQMA